jgi:hypothetical protein
VRSAGEAAGDRHAFGHPIIVYRDERLHWLTPLLRHSDWWVVLTIVSLGNAARSELHLFGAGGTIAWAALVLPVMVWAVVWAVRVVTRRTAGSVVRHVEIVDRYWWERVDEACRAILGYLPDAAPPNLREVRAAVITERWNLACLIRDRSRLVELQKEIDHSLDELTDDDPLRHELAQRRSALEAQLTSLSATIKRRIDRLRGLAARGGEPTGAGGREALPAEARDATQTGGG